MTNRTDSKRRNPGRRLLGMISGVALLSAAGMANAATLALYDFTGSVLASHDVDGNSTAGALSAGTGLTTSFNTTLGNSTPSLRINDSGVVVPNNYLSFVLSPLSGFELNLSSLTLDGRRFSAGNLGSTIVSLFSSLDSFASSIGSATFNTTSFANNSISLGAAAFQNLTAPITFRLFVTVSGGTGNANNRGDLFDNIVVNGTDAPVPLPPAAWLLGSALVGLTVLRRRTVTV